MNLLLEIISHQRHIMTEEQSQFIFKVAGGTIGRNQNNDWLIDDPERLISGQHASIHFEKNHFIIMDTSTNGLFVNQNQQALGDQSHIINNGDIFSLGQFSLQATLIATQSKAVFSTSTSHSLLEDDANFPEHQAIPLHSSISNEAVIPVLPHELPQNLNQLVDPLRHFNDSSMPGRPAEQDILSESNPVDSVLNPVPSTQSYFDLPDAIPENWLNKQSTERKNDEQDNSGLENNIQKNIVGNFEDFKKDSNLLTSNQEIIKNEVSVSPKETANKSINDDILSIKKSIPQARPQLIAKESSEVTQGVVKRTVEEKPFPPPELVADNLPDTTSSSGIHQDAVNILFEILGINPADISPEQLPELTKNIALIAKNSMSGITRTMSSRAHLKNEFRLSMTTIQTQENNPLKFCINYEQLIHYMLVNPMSGYLDAEQAVKESFEELQEHQVGVMAGMKSALKYMLDKLSPEKIIQKSDRSKLNTLALGSKKSRYWDAYTDLYNEFKDEEDVFATFFGNEFCKAYERQIEDIRQARK